MADKQDKNRHADIWNLLYEYADIRDELEDTLTSIRLLHEEMECAMVDITEELEHLHEHLAKCSERLIRFRNPQHKHNQYMVIKEQGDIPFMD